jgi:hypothetical protein
MGYRAEKAGSEFSGSVLIGILAFLFIFLVLPKAFAIYQQVNLRTFMPKVNPLTLERMSPSNLAAKRYAFCGQGQALPAREIESE